MSDQIRIILRDGDVQDKDFIMATWLKNNRYGSPYFELQDPKHYFEDHAFKIKSVICRPDASVLIACDESNPSWIVGFGVFEPGILHYVYVRKDYRKRGIAKQLCSNKIIRKVTGITKIGASIAKSKGFVFEPL